MGKKYVGDCILAKEINSTTEFENMVKSLFAEKTIFRLVFNGYKAVLRLRITSIDPNGVVTFGTKGYEVQTIVVLKKPNNVFVSTEYGYVGSGGSSFRYGQAVQAFMLKQLNALNEAPKKSMARIDNIQNNETPAKDIPTQILELKKLQDQGIITEEEFVAFKKKLLESL